KRAPLNPATRAPLNRAPGTAAKRAPPKRAPPKRAPPKVPILGPAKPPIRAPPNPPPPKCPPPPPPKPPRAIAGLAKAAVKMTAAAQRVPTCFSITLLLEDVRSDERAVDLF